jgi:hypothetical protein
MVDAPGKSSNNCVSISKISLLSEVVSMLRQLYSVNLPIANCALETAKLLFALETYQYTNSRKARVSLKLDPCSQNTCRRGHFSRRQ